MRGTPTEGRSGVPLRFPRPVMPAIATGMAAVWVVAASAPAFADQVRQQEWWLSRLQVSQAWQASKGAGVTVAVLSDGVTATQADISSSVTTGPDLTGTAQGFGPFFGKQGTAIASLIAGRGHGSGHASGIIGVAPRARILSVRVTLDPADTALDSASVGARLPDAIASGIRYAVAHHAKVIELPQDPGEPDPAVVAAIPIQRNPDGTMPTHPMQTAGITAAAGGSAAEKAAVAYALHKKVVLVAPAGDNAEGTDAVSFPAAYHGVISVGAFSASFTKAAFSSHQPYVTVTAAGEGVMAATAAGSYAEVSSTNAASAVVAGIAALIRSRYPALTPAQVTRALTTSTVFKPGARATAGSGAGTVDAQRALLAAAALAAPPDSRAGAGAQAFSQPASPGVSPVSSNALAPRIVRAAAISAGLLIVLLLLVIGYVVGARRRERRAKSATAQWARSTQSAYSPYGPAEADKMLEFFAAPAGEPAVAAGPFPQFQAGQLSSAGFGSAAADMAGPGAASDTSGGASGSGGDTGVGAWVPLGASARSASRQPRVSGTPPWEPAAQPDSELPWTSVPGPAPGAASRAATTASPAADPIWPTAAGSPAPSSAGPSSAGPSSAGPSSAGPSSAGPSSAAPSSAALSSTASDWETLAASAPAPVRPPAEDDLRGRQAPGPAAREVPDSPAPSSFTSVAGRRGSPSAPGSAPRSPSGSNWELPDSESKQPPAASEDSEWHAGSDAFRSPASDPGGWKPPEGEARWQLPDSEPNQPDQPSWQPAESGARWALPDSEPSQPDQPSWQPAESGARWESAAAEPRSGTPGAEPSESDMHWLPAAAADQWQAPQPGSQWQSAGSGRQWQPPESGRQWETSGPASSQWQPSATAGDDPAASWQPGPATPEQSDPAAGAGSGWGSAASATAWPSVSTPAAAEPPAQRWGPAAEAGQEPAADPPWETAAAANPPWESAAATEPAWEPARASTQWERAATQPRREATAAAAPWEPTGDDAHSWGSAAGTAGDAAAGGAAAGGAAPGGAAAEGAAAGPPWTSASADALQWGSAAASTAAAASAAARTPWEPAAEPPGWGPAEPAASAEESASDGDQRFSWRSSAQTESFPAITDD
jgi:serine protease